MTQINIEPKPRRGALPFVLGLLLVAAIALAVWFFLLRGRVTSDGVDTLPAPAAPADTAGGI